MSETWTTLCDEPNVLFARYREGIISAVFGEVVTEIEVADTSEYATAYERLAAIRDAAATAVRVAKYGPDQGSSVPWTQVVCSHDDELH